MIAGYSNIDYRFWKEFESVQNEIVEITATLRIKGLLKIPV